MGSILTRTAILTLGYIYPAYMCFQTTELSKPNVEELQLWCQYWIIVAALTAFERVADTFVSWLPFYNAGKIAFLVYLWHPSSKGTAHVYATFVKPMVSKHRHDIDQNWAIMMSQTIENSRVYWDKFLVLAQVKISHMLPQPPKVHHSLATSQVYPTPSKPVIWTKMPPGNHQSLEQVNRPVPAPMMDAAIVHRLPLAKAADSLHQSAYATMSTGPQHAQVAASRGRKDHEEKVEADFELLDANEVPAPSSTSVANVDTNSKIRFRWWWQRSNPQD